MLKNWFNTFKTSVSQPKEYPLLMKRTFWSGYWYLFWLILIGVFLKVLVFAGGIVSAVPSVKQQLPQVKEQMRNAYPKELVVDIRNGEATTNVQVPYTITLREVAPQLAKEEDANLVVIDTNATAEDFQNYRTAVLLTKNSIVYPGKNNSSSNSYEVLPLSEFKEPVTIDRSLYDALIVNVLPFVDKVPAFMYGFAAMSALLFPLLGAFFVLHGSLLYLLFMVLVVWLISKIMKKKYNYQTLYKASMYGLTIPLVITYITDLLELQIPGLYHLLFVGWMICVLTLSKSPVYTQNNARQKKVSSR